MPGRMGFIGQRMSRGLGKLSPSMGGGAPALGVAKLLVVIGDSNGRGWAENQASLSFTPTPSIQTFVSSLAFATYDPATATGMEGGVNTTWVGGELFCAQALRTADPSKPVFILKNAVAGTRQTTEWKVTGGTYTTPTRTLVAQAISAMAAMGYIAEVQILISLGINENTARQSYLAEARLLLADMASNWGLTANSRVTSIRSTLDNGNMVCIRAAQQIIGHENALDFLMDADAFGKNADVTHYNLAGLASVGGAWASIITQASSGLDTDLLLPEITFDNNTGFYAWTLNTGWTIAGTLAAAGVAAFGTSSFINDFPFEAGASYTLQYDLVVSAGNFRFSLGGGTTKNGATQTTSGPKTEVIVANAGNTRLVVNAAGSGFTGSVDNLRLRKI